MSLATTADISLIQPDPPFLPFWAWSTLLHVGVVGLFSFIHVTTQIEQTRSLVNVTLVETSTTSSIPESTQPEQKEPVPQAPPPMKGQRSVAPVPQHSVHIPSPLKTPTLRTTLARVSTPSQPKERVQPIQRRVLRDSRATDHLNLKNYLKVAQRKSVQRSTLQSSSPAKNLSLAPTLIPAGIPVPIQTSPESHSHTAKRRTIQPNVLQAKPGNIKGFTKSKARVGMAIPLVYPLIAKKNEWEGTVRIRVVVQPSGFPETISIKKSSGHKVLDNAAVDALRKTRFIPAKDGNIPIRSIVEIPIKFDLKSPT